MTTNESGWMDKLHPFLENISLILAKVEEDRKKYTIWPENEYIFNIFRNCPYDKLKCIIVGQDPYFTKGVANGIAMCCERTGKLQPSLKMFYDEINRTIYNGEGEKYYDPSLKYLASQGVLLINRALTVRENTPRSHLEMWKPFIEYLFMEVIHNYPKQLPIVMLGKESQYVNRYIHPMRHYPFNVEHPAAASYRGGKWNSDDVFKCVNKLLEANGEEKIMWLNENYEAAKSE